MSERVAADRAQVELILRPRIGTAIGFAFYAAFLAFIGWLTLMAGGLRMAWWAVAAAWLLAGLAARGAIRQVRRRSSLALRLTPERFSLGDDVVRRFQVTSVRYFSDFHFKGVRVDLGAERSLAIPDAIFVRRHVLAAFRKQGYPVE